MPRRRGRLLVLALGLLMNTLQSEVEATDRIVGAEAPNGGAYLIKHFRVPAGAVITGVTFVNNDPRTLFPRVLLFRSPVKTISGARILAEARNVRPLTAHRVEAAFPPLVIGSSTDIYLAVAFPANDGVQDVGLGPGIGAQQLEPGAPGNSYFASDADSDFGAMDVEYQIELMFQGVSKTIAGEQETDGSLEAEARIRPNPFNPSVTIEFDVPRAAEVRIAIHDIAGRLVNVLVDGPVAPGLHEEVWDGRDQRGQSMASGIYIARIQIGDKTLARKLLLAK